MKRSKHLKDPLILFLILVLTAGIVAVSGDNVAAQEDFGSDDDEVETTQSDDSTSELREGFGDDTDDAGIEAETSSDTDTSTSTETDDAGTSRDGFGSDTDDNEFTQAQTDNASESDDAGTSRDGFGDDTDDEGPTSSDGIDVNSDNESVDRDGFGDDTDDEGTSEGTFGNDTDDEGTSRDNFGEEDNSSDNSNEDDSSENQSEDDGQTENTDSSDGESTSYDSADIEIVETTDTGSSVEIQSVDWPNSVRLGSSFEVCAEVSASETPELTLLKDGVEVDSASQDGNSCLTTTLEQPGDHTLEIGAELDDAQDSETSTVNAYTLDSGNDNQATGQSTDSSTNNGLIILIILAAVALGSAVIYRVRG